MNTMNTEFSGRPEKAEESERAFYRSMEELLPIIEREGIDLLIDPHPDDFVEEGLAAIRVIRGLNSKNVGLVYVASHSFHMKDAPLDIMRAAGTSCAWSTSPTPWTTTPRTGCVTSPTRPATRSGCTST